MIQEAPSKRTLASLHETFLKSRPFSRRVCPFRSSTLDVNQRGVGTSCARVNPFPFSQRGCPPSTEKTRGNCAGSSRYSQPFAIVPSLCVVARLLFSHSRSVTSRVELIALGGHLSRSGRRNWIHRGQNCATLWPTFRRGTHRRSEGARTTTFYPDY